MTESNERKPQIHELKIFPLYFRAVLYGHKKFELRRDDRDYQVGDTIILREYNGMAYTGNCVQHVISYVLRNCQQFGLEDGYCIIGW